MKKDYQNDPYIGKVGLLICTKGNGKIVINGKPFMLSRGMVVVSSPILCSYIEDCDEYFELLPLRINIEYMVSNAQKVFHHGFPIIIMQNPVIRIGEEDQALVRERIREIDRLEKLKELDEGNGMVRPIFELSKIQLSISTFMYLIGKYYASGFNNMRRMEASNDMKLASQFLVTALLSNNVERHVSWYAEQAHLSVGHFSAMIRKVLGESPQHWIKIITINKAKSLLQKRDMSIKEIAQEMGFPEQFTFRKYFKEHAGMSPKEYRQTILGDSPLEAEPQE